MTLGREQDDSQRWERYSREIGVLHIFSLYNFPMHLERGLHGGMGFAGIAARVGPSYHILTSSSCKPSDSQPLRQGRPPDQPGLAVSWRQHATASLPEPVSGWGSDGKIWRKPLHLPEEKHGFQYFPLPHIVPIQWLGHFDAFWETEGSCTVLKYLGNS